MALDASADIDDLKGKVFGRENKRFYRPYYKGELLRSGEKIPLDTTSDQPIFMEKFDASEQSSKSSILTENNIKEG